MDRISPGGHSLLTAPPLRACAIPLFATGFSFALYLVGMLSGQLTIVAVELVWCFQGLTVDLRPSHKTGVGSCDERPLGVANTETAGTVDPLSALIANLDVLRSFEDPLLHELAQVHIAGLSEDLRNLTAGRIGFEGTETWRTAYEKVLCAPGVTAYRSVSWAKTADYWQDRPGQQSIRLNYDLLDRGVEIERIVILGWNLWFPEIHLPGSAIRRWLEEQHYRGISLALVRESDLLNETDLLRDFGIYGTRATGEQELDEESRTVRFELRFDEPGIRLAADRWERLKLYARPYSELLDQTSIGE